MADPRPLILTRPKPQSEAFAAAVDARLPGRFRVLVAPMLEIVPRPVQPDLTGVQGLLFSSANGVGVRNANAMSFVTWSPAIPSEAVWRIAPWV